MPETDEIYQVLPCVVDSTAPGSFDSHCVNIVLCRIKVFQTSETNVKIKGNLYVELENIFFILDPTYCFCEIDFQNVQPYITVAGSYLANDDDTIIHIIRKLIFSHFSKKNVINDLTGVLPWACWKHAIWYAASD